ncbi:MAG: DUF4445 domain-containing protein [Lachnospiraceae bacterium]|nr:DUF4445 domain-containing protein [Lachnospiraceae bacterium]
MSDLQLIIKYENDNAESKLFFQAGESLLLLCQKAGIVLSLNCGGKGICGKCKVRFLKGAPMPGISDRRFFKPDELRQGYRLGCLAKLYSDCEVVLPKKKEPDIVEDFVKVSFCLPENIIRNGRAYFVTTDIGTTTLVMQKRSVLDGSVCAVYKAVNAQKCYGADVISRMEASMHGNREDLSNLIRGQIQEGFTTLGLDDISFMVVAANTTMVHLLMGYDVSSLSKAPFLPKTLDEIETDIADIPTYIMPGFSAFVGGDIFSGLLALGMKNVDLTSDRVFEHLRDKLILLLDLGTNAEMALIRNNRLVATSAAAGSAFDSIADVGIYGADIISFLYRLLQEKKIDVHGTLQGEWFEKGVPYVVDEDKDVNTGIDAIYITQKHIRQMQLAKAAVRCGIDYLVEKFGCTMQEIDHVYVAGGFGYYLDIEAAFGVGLLPETFQKKTTACGNTALSGAAWYGYSKIKKNLDDETVVNSKDQTDGGTSEKKETNIVNIINKYVNLDRTLINLANEPDFSERYISYLDFEK